MFNSPTKDSPSEAATTLHVAANNAGRKVRSLYTAASDEMAHTRDKVTGEIRSNPVRSSVIALGVGVLLGALLRR
jgi:ElaB/YqjD/DUF883 family membrane-anchored ribosome-binding protein